MAPVTRSASTLELEPNPSRTTDESPARLPAAEEPRTDPPGQPPTIQDADLAEIQATIDRLARYKELQEQKARLESEIAGLGATENSPRRRRYDDDYSDDEREIKLKNVPVFSLDYTLQKRQEWFLELTQLFEGAPRKYNTERKRITGALCYMEPICRQRWYRHLEEKGTIHLRNIKEDWPYFKEWTLTLIKNAASLQADVRSQLERIFQRKDESPKEFHPRLDALEEHFARQPEKERALAFFAKLQYDLQELMNLHLIKLPEDRDEMISMAQHFWEIQVAASNRKRKTADDSSNSSRKTRKTARGPRD